MDNMANTKEMSKYILQALSILYHGYAWSDLSPKQKYEVLQVGMRKKIDDDNK